MSTYFFVFLNLIFLGILIYAGYTDNYRFRLISKTLCSICFLSIAISAYINNPSNLKYFLLIFIGLIFSLCGDIFLGIHTTNSKTKFNLFLIGLISFSITHILYSICFVNISSLYFKVLLFSLFLAIILFASIKLNKKIILGKITLPGAIYCFLISFMVCSSLLISTVSILNPIMISLIIIGAICFMISDYILAFVVFYNECPKIASPLNLVFYYIGQILIALSILYI